MFILSNGSMVKHSSSHSSTCVTNFIQLVFSQLLQFRGLRVGQWIESCIRLTQENSIENSVQDCLSYILKAHGPCYVLLAYPK